MKIDNFRPFSVARAEANLGKLKEVHLAAKGYWADGMYHGGYVEYWLLEHEQGWALEAVERNGCLDGLTEEDVQNGALNDDQIEALGDMSLEEAQKEESAYLVAVTRDPDSGAPPSEILDLLYTSLAKGNYKFISDREDDYGMLSDDAFDAVWL